MYNGTQWQLLAAYNRWQNECIYALCAELTDAERKRDLGAFFRSIHGTLNHLLYGDRVWLGRFTGRPCPHRLGEEIHAGFDALRAAREALDGEIVAWAAALDEDWLRRPLEYVSGVDGRRRALPAWVLVTQMFNHQTHHRGQVTTLLKQLGRDPGITDIPWLPELAAEG